MRVIEAGLLIEGTSAGQGFAFACMERNSHCPAVRLGVKLWKTSYNLLMEKSSQLVLMGLYP